MYSQVEKHKENKSKPVTNSAAYKKNHGSQVFGFKDNRLASIAQRKGTVVELLDGKVKLYKPEAKTIKAAYYCHGVYNEQMDPVAGITLGYLAPHKSTTTANASAVLLAPNREAEKDINGKWHSYTLTQEANASEDDAWLELAKLSGRAIASIQDLTTTSELVLALKEAGYSDLLAVHCREVFGEENVDWDPETNAEVVIEQEGWLIDRVTMNGWMDSSYINEITEHTKISKDEILYDKKSNKARKVLNPDENGQVRICTYE